MTRKMMITDKSDFQNVSIAFDIGSYDGSKTQQLLNAGVNHVVCAEANPTTFNKLYNRFKDNSHVSLEHCIMCNEVSDSKMFYTSRMHPPISTANTRFVEESRFSNKSDENNIPYTWDTTVNLQSKTIDSLISEHGIPDFIKIDVEGNEMVVISGLTEFLRDTVLCFELHEEFNDIGIECINHLDGVGYNKFGLIAGDDIYEFPNRYHNKGTFIDRIHKAFPSDTEEFFGMVFARYE